MSSATDTLVIGGGIIGLTAAYFLARDGLRVRIVDRGDLGQESSWAGAGIIPPGNPARARSPFDRLRALSASRFAEFSAELCERTGVDNGYRRCGGLEILTDLPAEASEEWHGEGVAVQALNEQEIRALEPNLTPGIGKGLFLPDMAQIRNPRHIKALVSACQSLGVVLSPETPVHGLAVSAGRIVGAKSGSEMLVADRYLIAAGAWTDQLLEPLGWRPGIQPVRGQIVLLQPSSPLLRRVIVRGAQYLVPRPDGRVLAGSTEEHVGFDKRTTASAIHELLQLAFSLVPALAQAALERCWAGLRPGSPDGLPFLGAVPGHGNLFLAAGHFRAGIQLSIGTGILLKELLLGQPTSIPAEPFSQESGAGVRGSDKPVGI